MLVERLVDLLDHGENGVHVAFDVGPVGVELDLQT
jgi:hypothetical protein